MGRGWARFQSGVSASYCLKRASSSPEYGQLSINYWLPVQKVPAAAWGTVLGVGGGGHVERGLGCS